MYVTNDWCFFCSETNLKCRQALPETAEMHDDNLKIGKYDGKQNCATLISDSTLYLIMSAYPEVMSVALLILFP